jgi:hypothetical protein
VWYYIGTADAKGGWVAKQVPFFCLFSLMLCVCVCVRERERESMCVVREYVCVCVYIYIHIHVCVCVCVCVYVYIGSKERTHLLALHFILLLCLRDNNHCRLRGSHGAQYSGTTFLRGTSSEKCSL